MIKKKIILLLIYIIIPLSVFPQDNIKPNTSSISINNSRDNWGIGFLYSEKGYGLSVSLYKNISKSSDLLLNLAITGITDPQEFEQFDIYNENSYIPNKINRVYMIPLNIGLQHYMFLDDIEGNFRPFIQGGITPALALTNPYSRSYFNAFGYFNASFALGGYIGAGLEYIEFKKVALTMNVRYYYLPVIGSDVYSLKNKPITDLGGLHINFGLNFLH